MAGTGILTLFCYPPSTHTPYYTEEGGGRLVSPCVSESSVLLLASPVSEEPWRLESLVLGWSDSLPAPRQLQRRELSFPTPLLFRNRVSLAILELAL